MKDRNDFHKMLTVEMTISYKYKGFQVLSSEGGFFETAKGLVKAVDNISFGG